MSVATDPELMTKSLAKLSLVVKGLRKRQQDIMDLLSDLSHEAEELDSLLRRAENEMSYHRPDEEEHA